MKTIITTVLIIIYCGAITQTFAQKNRTLSNGFSIKAQIGFPPDDYGANESVESEYAYGVGWGLQLGNQWYFSPKENYGFGLMVNWFDVSWTRKKTENNVGKVDRATIDATFLEVGPVGTYALSEAMALDAYYNLRPTVMSTAYSINDGEEEEAYGGFGVTHAFGAGFRYDMLFVGLEYILGTVTVSQTSEDIKFLEDEKIAVNNFRIVVGVKF